MLTDTEIKEAMEKGEIKIENFQKEMLQAASYDMRVGERMLISGKDEEINLDVRGSISLKAGEFALITTRENVTLANNMVGHIGLKSYYVRKGVVVLAGLQIDPGFTGILVLGVYNASSRSISIDYLNSICTVEFHRLSKDVEIPFNRQDLREQKLGAIPKADRDYLKTLETQSLSEVSESVRQLSINVSHMAGLINKVMIPLTLSIFAAVVVGFIFSSLN